MIAYFGELMNYSECYTDWRRRAKFAMPHDVIVSGPQARVCQFEASRAIPAIVGQLPRDFHDPCCAQHGLKALPSMTSRACLNLEH